ncbi:MAG TPA: hypothetical protein VEJ39_08455 [Candidatus Acidoferrales bacterium]|nr:hypothetical protein [Candidatus Acidoferrales bacterium]
MTSYQALLGKQVEAHYRASDLQLSAAGTLVADSGRTISIEDQYVRDGCQKKTRLEIPYDFLFRVVEKTESSERAATLNSPDSAECQPLAHKRS